MQQRDKVRMWWDRDSARANVLWLLCASLAIGILTSLLGIGVDHLLHSTRPLYASDIIEGFAAFLLSLFALLRVQQQRRDLLIRMQAVEDVNHHVRNALTAVTYSAVLKEDPVLNAIVADANERIDWTLRSVLPRTSSSVHLIEERQRWCSGMHIEDLAEGSGPRQVRAQVTDANTARREQ